MVVKMDSLSGRQDVLICCPWKVLRNKDNSNSTTRNENKSNILGKGEGLARLLASHMNPLVDEEKTMALSMHLKLRMSLSTVLFPAPIPPPIKSSTGLLLL